ncbi:MAG TPA: ABC transporter permease [Terriglobia bacterium]|nr:ABC transporter permease [Terriglobia bacterium]
MRWYQRLFRRGRTERQLDAELRFHLERQIADYIAAGMTPDEARRRARLEFGGLDQVKEECRDVGAARFVESLIQDVRYGLRQLRRNPGFTAVAVLTLALGIGANTAVFTVVNAVLLRPLPYKNPGQLVTIRITQPQAHGNLYLASGPDFQDWRKQNRVFEDMAAGTVSSAALTSGSEPLQLQGFEVSPRVFRVLGISPLMGRTFSRDETQPGRDQVVILSYGLWQRAFGGERGIIGKEIVLGGKPYDVVGIMPRSLKFPNLWWGTKAEYWIPLGLQEPVWRTSRANHWLWALARMKSGITVAQAQANMDTISRRLQQQYPRTNTGVRAKVLDLREEQVKQVKPAILILFAAVGFLLLIACANIVNLLLAKAISRQREIAIRLAVGSGKVRLIRQLLTESVLLFLAGGLAGLLVGWGALRILLYAAPQGYVPGITQVRLDAWVFAFTLGVAFLAGILAGLAPAIHSLNLDLQSTLKEGAKSGSADSGGARSILTTAEIALALVMLIGAGLAIKSMARLMAVQPGFDPHNVLKARIALPQARYGPSQQTLFYERLVDRVRALPGVQSASATDYLPLQGNPGGFVYVEGQPLPKDMFSSPVVDWSSILPGYFRTMRILWVRGRDFTLADGEKSPKVAIINQAMARLFWPNQNPVGKRFTMNYQKPDWITVVGVAGDVKEMGLDQPATPEAYFPEAQRPDPDLAVVLRASISPLSEADGLTRTARGLDKELPVYDLGTLGDIVSQSSEQRQFMALLLGVFASAALALALVGIYGVISYSVERRSHEFGIRMALGAQRRDVLRLVAAEGLKMGLIGVAAGLAAALGLTRLMASVLYEVKPNDPGTFVIVSIILTIAALLASYIPAHRATKVDPMVALRHE